MAATTLSTWLKWWFDQYTPDTQEISDTTIADILRRKRIVGFDRALRKINARDAAVDIDTVSGQITITMTDLDGLKTEYGHAYIYYLYDGSVSVTVDDVAIAASAYTYHPTSMNLVFTAARTETAPTVKITGQVVDVRAAAWEFGEMLITRMATLPSVRDMEFNRLAGRIRSELTRTFGAKIIRRR